MMNIIDRNKQLTPPEGYDLIHVSAQGSFLVVTYEQSLPDSKSIVDVYLNSEYGREVARVQYLREYAPEPPAPKREPWYKQLWDWYQKKHRGLKGENSWDRK